MTKTSFDPLGRGKSSFRLPCSSGRNSTFPVANIIRMYPGSSKHFLTLICKTSAKSVEKFSKISLIIHNIIIQDTKISVINVEHLSEKDRYLVWNLEGKEAKVFQLTFVINLMSKNSILESKQ